MIVYFKNIYYTYNKGGVDMTYTYNYNFDSSDAVLGGMLVCYLITFLVIYVLSVIAMWKIFTKAG